MSPAFRSVNRQRPSLRHLLPRLLSLLIALSVLGAFTLPPTAQDIHLLYSENFDDGAADGWTLPSTVEGAWWVENGQLVGSGHSFAELRDVEWGAGPHTLKFDLSPLGVANGLHVNLHHSDLGRYYVGFRQVNEDQLLIYINRNLWGQPPKELASNCGDHFPYRDFINYRVSIDFGDGQFNVALIKQGQESTSAYETVISAQDSQPLPPGGISFESLENMPVRLDNLQVHGPGLPVVFPVWPQPPVAEPPQQTEPPLPEPPENEPPQTEPPQPGPEQPQPPPPGAPIPKFRQCDNESLLYSDAFEDALAQGWKLESGWSVGSGLLQGKSHSWADYPAAWSDLTFYAVYSQPQNGGAMHINLRKSDTGRYFVGVSSEALSLTKQVGWGQGEQFIPLTDHRLGIDPEVWHTLAFAVHGGFIRVSLDGNVQLEFEDDRPLPSGGIAFETLDNSSAQIEEVWVCGTPVAVKTQPPPVKTQPSAPPPQPPKPPGESKLPDLWISRIAAGQFNPASRTQLLRVTVINLGDGTAASNRMRVKQQGGDAETSSSLISLLPGQSTDVLVSLSVPPGLLGRSARYEVELDPDHRITELNEKNNLQLSDPVQFPKSGIEIDWPPIIGVIVGLTMVILVGRWVWRRLRRPRAHDRPGKEPEPLPPILPPVRLLNLWLTEGASGKGPRLPDDRPLVAGKVYCLHAQIVSHETRPKGRSGVLPAQPALPLHAVVFSPGTDFPVQNPRQQMDLAPAGSSQPIFWPIQPGQPGLRRARVCLYYGNLLLQSAYLDAAVVAPKGGVQAPAGVALRRMLDYVTNASLSGLERLPQPSVSIFTNQAPGGRGWIGVYAAGDPLKGFTDGLLLEVDPHRLSARAGPLRQRLLEIEEAFNYTQTTPSSEAAARQFSRLEQDLASLACSGWTLYDTLFLQSSAVSKQVKACFDQALRSPGLVAIDRCRSENATLPWATLYDLEVDTGKPDLLRLCPVFRAELLAHWSPDLAKYEPHHDWLDNPQGCRLNPRCPLAGQNEQVALLTICPFGFWGFRHQISQPLQSVTPTPVGRIPEEIARAGEYDGVSSFDSTIFLRQGQNERLKLAIGVHPGLSQAERLPVDVTALRPHELEITYETTRDRVLDMLKQGGFHFYILYCHGDCDEREMKFKLVFGPLVDERAISCENLNPLKISWPEQPKPLVLLNGCETVAVTPEMVHGLLDRLHELGAAGVVGTEIQVYPSLAYPFGLELLERFLCGASVGEAFLEQRKELLRKFNPLGLAYTYYAPAALHLHVDGACGWCAAHQVHTN